MSSRLASSLRLVRRGLDVTERALRRARTALVELEVRLALRELSRVVKSSVHEKSMQAPDSAGEV